MAQGRLCLILLVLDLELPQRDDFGYALYALRFEEVLKVPLGRLVVRSGAFFEVFNYQTYFMGIGVGIVSKGAEIKYELVLLIV